MLKGYTVSHLVALAMHRGVQGGPTKMHPVVWSKGSGGPMTFQLVHADDQRIVLGEVDHTYDDTPTLIREIAEAHTKWGYPTAERLAVAFPAGTFG